jgi:hypothetical protein
VLPAEEGLPGPASRRVDEATRDRGLNLVQERSENLELDRNALLESMSEKVPEDLDGLTENLRNMVYRMLGLAVTPAAEGFEATAALSGVLYFGNDGLRDATVKKLKGARFRTPSGLAVEVQAIGRETTGPMRSW